MSATGVALGVNIDHVAMLRAARRARDPDPVHAALQAEHAGADCITLQLREDRRHVQDGDVLALVERLSTRLNLEIALTDELIGVARRFRPADVCLVPETRTGIAGDGGTDAVSQLERLRETCALLASSAIRVAVYVEPEPEQVEAVAQVGAAVIDLHTGRYAAAHGGAAAVELQRLRSAARFGASLGLEVHAGHGLDYRNVQAVAAIPEIAELNIGHAIVARALFCGMDRAVRDMKALLAGVRTASA